MMLSFLFAFGLPAPSTPPVEPPHGLDGVYGVFPLDLTETPAHSPFGASGVPVQIDGDSVLVDLRHPRLRFADTRGPTRGRLEVDAARQRLRITVAERIRDYTFAVDDGLLVLGALVRDGDHWSAMRGRDPALDCDEDDACLDWDGTAPATFLGREVRLTEEQRAADVVPLATGIAAGPVGMLPDPSVGTTGRWWAEGAPGTRIDAQGVLHGWTPAGNTWWSLMGADGTGVRPLPQAGEPIRVGGFSLHGPMGHGDGDGTLLWFGTTRGTLFVAQVPSAVDHCRLPTPWAELYRVERDRPDD